MKKNLLAIFITGLSFLTLQTTSANNCCMRNQCQSTTNSKERTNTMNPVENIIAESTKLSFEKANSFPEVLQKLKDAGIERYYADLVKLEKTYYGKGTQSYQDKMPLKNPGSISEQFSEEGLRNAITASQRGEIDYSTFLHRAMQSGVVSYTVFINGNRNIFFGKKGEVWTEHFPQK